ncbi:restriction endonuclease subunit S [Pseudomonas nicosulfuronedens]
MSELPIGWASAQIGDLCNLVNGRAFKPKEWTNIGLPIIRIQNLNNPDAKFNHFAGALDEKHLVKRDDLLFAWSGTPGTSFGAHLWRGNDAALNQHIFKIELSEKHISRDFFRYAINQKLNELIASAQGGVGLRHITKGTFEKTQISFPPLAEQIRIAQKLDELLVQVNILKVRIDDISTTLMRFRQSVLTAAVSGRLTEDWRNKDSLWSQKTIGDICIVSTGKTPKRDEPSYWANGNIPWITSAATRTEFCSEAEQFVTEHAFKDCNLKLFQPGTLIMAMYGEGKTRGQVSELKITATCNQACAAITVNETLAKKEFVKIRLQENYEEIRKQAVGGAQPNLNMSKVRALTINLPPLAEQAEIVRHVEELLVFAEQLEANINSTKKRITHLPQSILAKAFNGELTADWRSANPESISGENSADALLEKIKLSHGSLRKQLPHKRTGTKKMATKKKLTKDDLNAWVIGYENSTFSFDELKSSLRTDYEQLKDCLFDALADEKPLFKQKFEKTSGTITFIKVKK